MPGLERVRAWWQILDVEAAVRAGHGEIGMLEDGNVALHPGMNLALHGNGDFLSREGIRNVRRAGRLRLVPFTVVLRHRMDIVRRLVGVFDVKRLTDRKSTRLNSSHVRISYAVFCLKKKKKKKETERTS